MSQISSASFPKMLPGTGPWGADAGMGGWALPPSHLIMRGQVQTQARTSEPNRYNCKTVFLRLGDKTDPLLSFGHWILWEILPLNFLHFKSILVKGLESHQMRHNKGNSKHFTLRKRT